MNQKNVECALKALLASEQLLVKFTDALSEMTNTNTEEIELIFWKNVYEYPLDMVIENRLIILPEHFEVVLNHIKKAIDLYNKIIKNIFSKTPSRTTYQTHKQNSNHRFQILTVARCYSHISKLHRYQYKLNKNEEARNQVLNNYFLSFIADPSSFKPIFEIYQFLKTDSTHSNHLLLLFYSVKAFYLFKSQESTDLLTATCDYITSLTTDVLEIQNISLLAKIVKCLTTQEWKPYDSIIDDYQQIITQITSSSFENLVKEGNIACDNFYIMCGISIFLLEDLRRIDSVRFEDLLLHFSKFIDGCIERINNMICPKSPDDRDDLECDDTNIDSSYTFSSDMLNGEESEDGSDYDNGNEDVSYTFNFVTDRKSMEGLRNFNKSKDLTQNNIEKIPDITPFLKGIKLILDWFMVYNEAANVIKEVSGVDIEKDLKNLSSNLIFQDVSSTPKKFLPEDLTFFGHPSFFNIHNDLNLDNICFEKDEENSKYRINYIINLINDGNIFNGYSVDPSVYQISNNFTWSNKRTKSSNTSRNYTKKHNKSYTDPFITNGTISDRPRGFMIKDSKIKLVHIICFYDVLCRMDFVTNLLFGKVFRIFVPFSTLFVIDRLKVKDHIARRIARFLSRNCFPRMKGLRIQSSQDSLKLEKTPIPSGCDEKSFKYIDGVLKTGLLHLKTQNVSEPVVVLISKFEKRSLFGGEDFTSLNRDQFANLNCLLKPAKDRGLRILTIEEFKEEYIV